MTDTHTPKLVQARFEIDADEPEHVFPGWHDPTNRWNGWATPAFEREVAERIVTWVNRGHEEDPEQAYMEWRGDVAVYIDPTFDLDDGREEMFEPDADGRYGIGAWSWTWQEFGGEPKGWTLADWLRVRAERTRVFVDAANASNHILIAGNVPDTERSDHNSSAGTLAVERYDREHGYDFSNTDSDTDQEGQ